jgi:hypothetical protein
VGHRTPWGRIAVVAAALLVAAAFVVAWNWTPPPPPDLPWRVWMLDAPAAPGALVRDPWVAAEPGGERIRVRWWATGRPFRPAPNGPEFEFLSVVDPTPFVRAFREMIGRPLPRESFTLLQYQQIGGAAPGPDGTWRPFLRAPDVLKPLDAAPDASLAGTWDWTEGALPARRIELRPDGTVTREGDAAFGGAWALRDGALFVRAPLQSPQIVLHSGNLAGVSAFVVAEAGSSATGREPYGETVTLRRVP